MCRIETHVFTKEGPAKLRIERVDSKRGRLKKKKEFRERGKSVNELGVNKKNPSSLVSIVKAAVNNGSSKSGCITRVSH